MTKGHITLTGGVTLEYVSDIWGLKVSGFIILDAWGYDTKFISNSKSGFIILDAWGQDTKFISNSKTVYKITVKY